MDEGFDVEAQRRTNRHNIFAIQFLEDCRLPRVVESTFILNETFENGIE